MAKQRIIVDVYIDEESVHQIFMLSATEKPTRHCMPNCCSTSGIFTDNDDLDEFLAEHADEIEITDDYRAGC